MRERFKLLLESIGDGVFEKETEIGLSLLAAIAGESVLLLGPPGTAKSMVARRIKAAFSEGRSFEYLMNRFSTPDEIFGPVSISRLKESDIYERNIDGFMPSADVVFLDEIWKAGPAILNTLLTIINERIFLNGKTQVRIPMKLLIGASNELPASGEGLEALWDRFLVRIETGCVADEKNFYSILERDCSLDGKFDSSKVPAITADEYTEWQAKVAQICIEPDVLQAISFIRRNLGCLQLDDTLQGAGPKRSVYVSDRRWQHIMHLMRASAFVNDRKKVGLPDMLILPYCLWNEPDETAAIGSLVFRAILAPIRGEIMKMQASLKTELKRKSINEAFREAEKGINHIDDNKQLFDGLNYRIDRYGSGNTFIFFADYRNLHRYSKNDAPQVGVIYRDPANPKMDMIRLMSDHLGLMGNGVPAQQINLYRDDNNIFLDGVSYPIHKLPEGMSQPPVSKPESCVPSSVYEDKVEELADRISAISDDMSNGNLLCSESDRKKISEYADGLRHEIALLRLEIGKIYYE